MRGTWLFSHSLHAANPTEKFSLIRRETSHVSVGSDSYCQLLLMFRGDIHTFKTQPKENAFRLIMVDAPEAVTKNKTRASETNEIAKQWERAVRNKDRSVLIATWLIMQFQIKTQRNRIFSYTVGTRKKVELFAQFY